MFAVAHAHGKFHTFDRSTSSTVQKLAMAFLYICQMFEYWMGRITNLLNKLYINKIIIIQLSTLGFQSDLPDHLPVLGLDACP